MSVQNITRRAGPFTGTGQVSDFPFGFKVFISSDVSVRRSSSADAASSEVVLKLDEDYTVTLNANQDENPGGTVTLKSALPTGYRLAIISAIVPDQQVVLTNHGGFYPETLNTVHDKAIALIQELKEEGARSLKAPSTSEKSPDDIMDDLLNAQSEAAVYARAAAVSAAEAATHANTVRNSINEVKQVRDSAIIAIENAEAGAQSTIQTAGDKQVERVSAVVGDAETTIRQAGDVQCDRVAIAGKRVLARDVKLCGEGKDTVATALSEGSEYTLPEGVEYVVGFNHLRLSVNGLILYQGLQYTEVGTDFTLSTKVRMLMPLAVGDQVEAWVVPIGGSVDETTGVVTPEAGASCASQTWTVSSAVEAGSEVTLPNSMKYVVGRNHLRVSWNGLLLTPLYEFNEIGAEGSESATVTFTFPLSVGDEINVWTVPYERGNPSAVQGRIDALEEALAELSQKVVYKDAQSAS